MSTSISGPGRIRQLNRKAVLSHIRHFGKSSRSSVGKTLGLSPAAMTSVVNELLEQGLLRKSGPKQEEKEHRQGNDAGRAKRQGRPESILELNPEAACVHGILLRPVGKSCLIEGAWADYAGQVHELEEVVEVKTIAIESILDGITQITKALDKSIACQCDDKTRKVQGLTIGVPGVVESNRIPIAPKLSCIEGTRFMKALQQGQPYPVSFENDVNLGAMSELRPQPRLRNLSFAYLHVYSGVGSSIGIQGRILKGRRGWAGEIGQLGIQGIQHNQPTFEQLLSVDGALADLLESLGHPRDALDELVPYIEKGDKNVALVAEEYIHQLFNAINVLQCVLDLDEILIDFPSTVLFQKFMPTIKQLAERLPNKPVISTPTIGHQASLHGAALHSLDVALEQTEQRQIVK